MYICRRDSTKRNEVVGCLRGECDSIDGPGVWWWCFQDQKRRSHECFGEMRTSPQ